MVTEQIVFGDNHGHMVTTDELKILKKKLLATSGL